MTFYELQFYYFILHFRDSQSRLHHHIVTSTQNCNTLLGRFSIIRFFVVVKNTVSKHFRNYHNFFFLIIDICYFSFNVTLERLIIHSFDGIAKILLKFDKTQQIMRLCPSQTHFWVMRKKFGTKYTKNYISCCH